MIQDARRMVCRTAPFAALLRAAAARAPYASGAALTLLCACASVRPAGAPPFLTVTAQALPEGQAGWRPLTEGSALQSGDRFALRVAVERPAYVYLLQQTEEGRRQLWPPPGESGRVSPQVLVDLPGGGAYFRLDQTPRREILYAVATEAPLDAAQLEAALAAAVRRAGGREVPPTKDTIVRGTGDALQAPLQHGAAVAWLRFSHK